MADGLFQRGTDLLARTFRREAGRVVTYARGSAAGASPAAASAGR